MGNIKMVTGNGANVSAKDDRALHSATISPTNIVFADVGEAFRVEKTSNLSIRIHSGEGLFGGMHIRIPKSEYVDFQFQQLETGYLQYARIYVNYVRDSNSDEENISLSVAFGKAANPLKETPTIPNLGNEVLEDGYNAHFPLYLVKISESSISYIDKEFEVLSSLKNVHPIGSIYLTINDTNPENIFGGKWERFAEGRMLIGAGTGTDGKDTLTVEAEEQMGAYKTVLSKNNLPPHTHGLITTSGENYTEISSYLHGFSLGEKYAGSQTNSTGDGESFSILPPVVGVYIWVRTE